MNQEQITLFYQDSGSDKQYSAQLQQAEADLWLVNFQYGRRGGTLKADTKTKSPVCYADAKKVYDKLVKEKLGKGYSPAEGGTAFQGTASEQRLTGLVPQLLNPIDLPTATKLMSDSGWMLQQKMDGERRMVQVQHGVVIGSNRKGLSVPLPINVANEIIALTAASTADAAVDGELVGETYYVFDLLMISNRDITQLSAETRYAVLQNLDWNLAKACKLVPCFFKKEDKLAEFARIKAQRGEGVVFKESAAAYIPGRPNSGGAQLKHKFVESATVQVSGHTLGKQSVSVCALDDSGNTVQLGNVTIPPNYKELPEIGSIVEVQYLYAYPGGSLYQPIYKGTRPDQTLAACTTAQLKYKASNEPEEDEG